MEGDDKQQLRMKTTHSMTKGTGRLWAAHPTAGNQHREWKEKK
jgi:hypothetical protein